ncbi:vacuolar protein sorting-associated protein 11 homolog [Paramacrobiotus metropolitanus]|uniref:vacuolar protein sorting-associated protein 11 homolog n=1 Tax=Paramacrobiotus metropolitanus TaxID=2943436 RepID=UPI002445BFD4|nr:vacuolar protein sorting-associated protein 11 homolog [Paramacrobiotus metropolitanus]XP_055330951.1 vacuolar protein sorting-associated protein 11 homolog [Paramacrobiotus metropolitanus]XP_055330959.1 vacuolar protein sorting-associated protein 11 homolog [Paramacrobiotus metropolitanus]
MALNQWRKFAFFDKKLLKNEAGDTLDALKSYKIWSTTFGRGKMIFGDSEGWIVVMDYKQNVTSFRGYLLQVSHLFMTKQQNILVSVGEDSAEQGPMLKVWNFDKMDGGDNPSCSRMIRLNFRNTQELVSCFVVHENLNYLAIGYSSGVVILLKGDITKERNTSKHVVLHEGKSTITGLSFRPTTTAKGGIVLFISSMDEIWSYMIGGRDKEIGSVLDHHGCGLMCSTMTDSSTDYQFVIGRADALYFYLPDSRGQCLAFGGTKLLLEWCHGYLVVVSRKEESETRSTLSGSDSGAGEMQIITIYDVKNKLIAYYGPIQEVRAILCEWGSIFILCTDNKIYQIKEKELLQKLDMLFKKNLYSLAITLAKAQQYDQDALIDMFRQYGDHLYSKGDFDEAMAQYIKTIGRLEPSYVIRQFLDAQRIYNLTAYLSALHDSNLASQDHTTLLLNCYTKLKDEEQLDKFIMSKNSNHAVNFDVETAIRVLRQSGYFRHALHLAKTHQKHDWYLKIQLENNKDFVEALDYISKLEFESCEANLKCYGRLLISHASEQCTELLKKLCTDYAPKSDKVEAISSSSVHMAANPEDFFHIFVNHSGLMCEFLEYVANCRSDLSPEFYNTLLELYLENWKNTGQQAIKDSLEQKIMRLLQQENCCDPMQALLLCQLNDFAPGILYMFEQKHMYTEILQFFMDRHSFEQVVQTCRRFGDKESHLWVQAFWFFSESFGEYDKSWIAEVLKVIETKNLLPSLMVIDILSRNPNTTLDIIRDYVISRMKSDEKKIQDDEAQIQKFREKTEQIRKEVDQIKNGAQIFQDANCSACDKSLELPSVHFMCRHSYHQHCFDSYSDTDEECPICRPENRKLLDEINAQEQNRDLSQQFFSRVNKEIDSFSVVAEYFGKRLFGRQTPIDDLLHPGDRL